MSGGPFAAAEEEHSLEIPLPDQAGSTNLVPALSK